MIGLLRINLFCQITVDNQRTKYQVPTKINKLIFKKPKLNNLIIEIEQSSIVHKKCSNNQTEEPPTKINPETKHQKRKER